MTKSQSLPALLLLAAACGSAPAATTTPNPPAPAPAPDTVAGCMVGGEILFRETTAPILVQRHRREVLTIYQTGAWRLDGTTREATGCLDDAALATLRGKLTVVKRMSPDRATCAALPTYETLIEVPAVGALSYQWPCTLGPDEPTAAGIECARDLTWRDGDDAAVCEPASG